MKLTTLLASLALASLVFGCSSDSKTDLQKCVEEHKAEKLTETDAIGECLFDELMKSFATQADCEAYVTANGGFADTRTAGCQRYFADKNESAHADGGTAD
jgi:hypothetical protein